MQQQRAMARTTILSALILSHTLAQAEDSPTDTPKTKPRPAPVAISRHSIKSSRQQHKVEFQLKLADGVEINSEHKHKVANPLQIQFLDEKRRPIQSKITYPKAKVVPLEKDLGGDYHVYTGNPTFVAICDKSKTPTYVTVRYSGSRYRRS